MEMSGEMITGVPSIDEQHAELVRRTNAFCGAILRMAPKDMLLQSIGIRRPLHLGAGGEMGDGVGLDADAGYTQLLALDQGGAGAAERIEHGAGRVEPEPLHERANQMWRERQHEAVPFVDSTVLRLELVDVSIGCPRSGSGVSHIGEVLTASGGSQTRPYDSRCSGGTAGLETRPTSRCPGDAGGLETRPTEAPAMTGRGGGRPRRRGSRTAGSRRPSPSGSPRRAGPRPGP